MNKLLTTLFFLIVVAVSATAQQESQYTQFMHNKLALNPAYAGARDVPSLLALYRNQWGGFPGAPKSILFSFNTPLAADKVGFGLTIENHTKGIQQDWGATMAYSYKITFDKNTNLRLALQGRLRQLSFDFASPDLTPQQRNDPSVPANSDGNLYSGNFGLGAYLTHKSFYIGASVPAMLKNIIGFRESGETATVSPHLYIMTGVTVPVSETFKIEPSLLTKYVNGGPFDMDINVSMIFDDRVSTGLSYRLGGDDSFGESIDLTLFYLVSQDLGIGLAYDFTMSEIANYTSGSFEVMLRYDISKKSGDIANPRFF
ncbi:MAG: type IX secretion system membrane protein PorP/SprF [Bacteroidota bacterium]